MNNLINILNTLTYTRGGINNDSPVYYMNGV